MADGEPVKIPGQYAKFIAAIAGQAVVYLQWKYGAAGTTWLPIVLAAAAALGVYAVPNTPAPVPPAPAVAAQPVVPPTDPPVVPK
jgi:hypothetical protein